MEQQIINKGKNKALIVIFLIIGLSILISVFTQLTLDTFSQEKLIQSVVRLLLNIGLLYATYVGMKWAKITISILLVLAILLSLVSIIAFISNSNLIGTLLLSAVSAVYSYALYFFNIDKDFKAFFEYQKNK